MAQELHSLTLPITSGGTTTPTEFSVDYLARKDGYYESMAAGTADNLVDRKGNGTSQEFTFRTSCGSDSISDDGHGIIKSIHGNTIVWNQLITLTDGTYTNNGITFVVSNGIVTCNGTATADALFQFNIIVPTVGNKVLITGCPAGGSAATYNIGRRSGDAVETGNGSILSLTSNDTYFRIRIVMGQAITNLVFKPQLFNLTKMFGAGNEPSTVAEFKAMFPLNYYAYDAGSLLSFNGTGIKTVGFNQWDEQWESGAYDLTNGIKTVSADTIRSKNFIPIFPSTQYYCHRNSAVYSGSVRPLFYDINKNFISSPGGQSGVVFTTPANAYYMTFYIIGTSYSGGININLSWSGYRNGEYEAYWEETKALPISTYFTDGMKSAGSVYDELTPNKAVKRIGKVDLGSLTWVAAAGGSWRTDGLCRLIKPNTADNLTYTGEFLCSERTYTRTNTSDIWRTNFMSVSTTGMLFLNNGSTTVKPTGIAAYELATPTETTIEPPLNLTYKVADFGTELLLPENDDEPTTSPFKGVIKYSDDFTRMLANLPKNYQSQSSMDSLLSALGTACNGTFTKTWDSSNSKWTFTFTANA